MLLVVALLGLSQGSERCKTLQKACQDTNQCWQELLFERLDALDALCRQTAMFTFTAAPARAGFNLAESIAMGLNIGDDGTGLLDLPHFKVLPEDRYILPGGSVEFVMEVERASHAVLLFPKQIFPGNVVTETLYPAAGCIRIIVRIKNLSKDDFGQITAFAVSERGFIAVQHCALMVVDLCAGYGAGYCGQGTTCVQDVTSASPLCIPDLGPDEPQCCSVYGDPHVLTFDGLRYDYMGSCEYIIAMDLVESWIVYGTYKACGDKSKQLSCIVGITIHYGGQSIQFLRMYRINYGGVEFLVPLNTEKSVGGLRIENKDMKYYIYIGSTGVRVMWDGIVTSEVCLPSRCAGGVQGMCGNADCNPDNDFGGYATSSAFGNSWVVDQKLTCRLEPDSGPLRPCDRVTYDVRVRYEDRCNLILNMAVFSSCFYGGRLDRAALYANCMFDMCSGLTVGGGCKGHGDQRCDDELPTIYASPAEAQASGRTMVRPPPMDPACMIGYSITYDCKAWSNGFGTWWVMVACPGPDDLPDMRICP